MYKIMKILETAPEGLTTNQLSERVGAAIGQCFLKDEQALLLMD